MRVCWESRDPTAASARLRRALGTDVVATAASPDTNARDERIRVSDEPGGGTRVVVAFATVDAERAATDRGWRLSPLAPDLVLGAFAWAIEGRPEIVVLEPNSEDRI